MHTLGVQLASSLMREAAAAVRDARLHAGVVDADAGWSQDAELDAELRALLARPRILSQRGRVESSVAKALQLSSGGAAGEWGLGLDALMLHDQHRSD